MRPASLLGVVLLLAGAVGAQTRPATGAVEPSPYRITGTVVSATDGSPIPHAQLRPNLQAGGRSTGPGGGGRRQLPGQFRQFPAAGDVFDADERGHFSISLPSAGVWQLTAMASGFVAQTYEEHQEFSSSIVLTPESPTYDLVFRLRPEAVISGEVVDEAGEPVRNAQVSLLSVPPSAPDRVTDALALRNVVQTDDRGMYEFASLSPGDYRITVQVQPWYATAAQSRRFGPSDASTLDPSLDVTYPLTWYPGVDDPALAETISMHGGDVAQADFHMVPIPSIHLRIVPPAGFTANSPPGRAPLFPVVERLSNGVSGGGIYPVSVIYITPGGIDVGGLAPGLYQVRLQGQGSDNRVAVVELNAGGAHTLDLNAAPTVANVAIHFEGLTDTDENSPQVVFDSDDGHRVVPMNMEPRGGGNQRGRPGVGMRGQERVVQVPPGRYRVTLVGRPNVYLTGITGQSVDAKGRYVTVHAGDSSLTLRVATGTATVTGIVKSEGKPCVGAMVILVPATFGDPGSFAFLARDQSNTDGSFDVTNVIPGQYILVAIDDGWHINWSDQSTLRQYLTHGVPMDLGASANVKQNVQAQAP